MNIIRKLYYKLYIWTNGEEYRRDKKKYIEMNTRKNFAIDKNRLFPIVDDRYQEAGELGNYFWQDTWAAERIFRDKPIKHYDIGSRIDGFIGMISIFLDKVILIDIRPLKYKIKKEKR